MASQLDRRKHEVRERILTAAYELFARQGLSTTTIEDICEHADVANRTFFNHFPTRRDMVTALMDRQLSSLSDIVLEVTAHRAPCPVITFFDEIGTALIASGNTHPDLVGAIITADGYWGQRGAGLHHGVVELVKDGMAGGELTSGSDPETLADIIIGTLSTAIAQWTTNPTHSLTETLHRLGVALTDLLAAPRQKSSNNTKRPRANDDASGSKVP